MASIGSWGTTLAFSTSDRRILTFNDFKRTVTGNWTNHSRVGLKDRSEFTRPGLQKVTFTMVLDATLGVRPRAMLDALAAAVERGTVAALVIGGKRVGSDLWKIIDTTEEWETVFTRGELVRAKVDVTMEEYL